MDFEEKRTTMEKYRRNILQMGTLLGISFPKAWSDFYKLAPKDKVELITGDGKITIRLLGGKHATE